MKDKSIRKYIVYLKDECLLSFQEIANKLEREYGVKKSKQSIYGLYVREKESSESTEEKIPLVFDIVNLYVIGYNKKEIESLLNSYNISYNQVRYIIQQNSDLVEHIRGCKIQMLVNKIEEGCSYSDLLSILNYNSIKPKDSGVNKLLKEAYLNKIRKYLIDEVTLIESLNKTVAKEVANEIESGIHIK